MKAVKGMFRKVLGFLLLVAITLSYFPGTVFANVVAAKEYEVIFWDDYRCETGASITLGTGQYKNFVDLGWNDRVSCVVVGSEVKLTIYQHTNFGGRSKTLQANKTSNPLGAFSFAGDWWDNSISSVKIQ